MQGESERATAGGVHGRAQTCSARTTLCDARVTLRACLTQYSARTTLRACATLPRGIPLIPLNPGESRFKKSVSPASRARQAATGVSNPR